MDFSIDISLYKPQMINASYEFNTMYNRFNCPWENILYIDGDFLGKTTIDISMFMDTNKFKSETIKNILKKIFEYYEKQKITIAIRNIKSLKIVIIDKYLNELISFEKFVGLCPDKSIDELRIEYNNIIKPTDRRGICFTYCNHKAEIVISLAGCEETIKNGKQIFERHYPEYTHINWTLQGMVYYVLAHEIVHMLIPIDKGGEIFPIILGSRFAFENLFIAVPHGPELKNAWNDLGIKLSSKTDKNNLDEELNKCKKWIESLPNNKEFLDEIS